MYNKSHCTTTTYLPLIFKTSWATMHNQQPFSFKKESLFFTQLALSAINLKFDLWQASVDALRDPSLDSQVARLTIASVLWMTLRLWYRLIGIWWLATGNVKASSLRRRSIIYATEIDLSPRVNEQKVIGIRGLLGGDKYPPKKIIKKKEKEIQHN